MRQFPLFQSHLDLAHNVWSRVLHKGDIAVDATCGNGHDTLELTRLCLGPGQGEVYAIDIQEQALKETEKILEQKLCPETLSRVRMIRRCHSAFPNELLPESVSLIVYNLGYLPRGSKELTTKTETTLKSVENSLSLLKHGGCLSITCYPGHIEGAREEAAIIEYLAQVDARRWSCCHHRWINRRQAPSWILVQAAFGKE